MTSVWRCWFVAVMVAVLATPLQASGEQLVTVGGAQALLNSPVDPKGAIILVPGSDGHLNLTPEGMVMSLKGNQLVRTRWHYAALGFVTLLVDRPVPLADAIAFVRSIAKPVIVVANSRGALRVPDVLAGKPDALVITSGVLEELRATLGQPNALPPTLLVHHTDDACFATTPASAEQFRVWAKGRVELHWLSGGVALGDPCRARGYHGFNGIDEKVVAAVVEFAMRKHRKRD
ncbi:MAG: alpha/beta hydrolase [Hyphomicrobiaceae bacterium]